MRKAPVRLLYSAALAVLSALLAVFLFGLAEAHYERLQAERLLAVMQQIQIGVTDRATALRLTSPFVKHGQEFMYGTLPAIDFSYDNRSVSRLNLAPYMDFYAFIVLKENVVVGKHMREYTTACSCSVLVDETKRGLGFPGETVSADYPNHIVRRGWYSPTGVQHLFIHDDETYPEAQLPVDWQLNLSCLTRLGGGCKDARMFLRGIEPAPEVSKDVHRP